MSPAKRGPKADTLKIEGMTWQEAARKALTKPKPPGGWPKPVKSPKAPKKGSDSRPK